MKNTSIQISLLIALFLSFQAKAQDFSDFELFANYTLINTAEDQTEQAEDITLINAPYQGNDGIYSNGNYIGGDPDSCLIETPIFTDWDYTKLAFSFDFKYEEVAGANLIVSCGSSYRWLNFYVSSNTLDMTVNGSLPGSSSISVQANTWYHIDFIYENGSGKMYLDGTLVETEEFVINAGGSDSEKQISNTNFGMGMTYTGNLRNLKIYGTESSGVSNSSLKQLRAYPNPNKGNFYLDLSGLSVNDCIIEVYDLYSRRIFYKKIESSNEHIILPEKEEGLYFIKLSNEGQEILTTKILIKK